MTVQRPVKAVIFDLDGTILDSETLILGVAMGVVERHGGTLTQDAVKAGMGKRPLDAWQAVIDALGLDATAAQLYAESEPMLTDKWSSVRLMPGAGRLLAHLRAAGVPMGLATSTPRATFDRKMEAHVQLRDGFHCVHCGDEVVNGKPAPDCFLAAAKQLGLAPADCLVVEDAPAGVEAATAAGMRVLLIPSLAKKEYPAPEPAATSGVVEVLPSLLDFRPESYGLPPFEDRVSGALVLDPVWRIKGTVVKGFGRGSKELGIPTANLDRESLAGALAEAVSGIYLGWAAVGTSPAVHKMVISIGWNPFFQNKEKTAEPWLLHDFGRDFYGEELRLLVCAYIRPEANFESLDALVSRIHADADVARAALGNPLLAALQNDAFLQPTEGSAIP